MRNSVFWWMLIGFMVLLDLYFFQAMKHVTHSASPRVRSIIHIIYWVLSIAAILVLLILPYLPFGQVLKGARTVIFAIIAALFFAKLVAAIFFLVDDLRRGIQWIISKLFASRKNETTSPDGDGISRSMFLSWAGMIAASGLFGSLIYGFGNKYRYQVKRIKLSFANLPAGFKGIRIVHISDIHSGSFTDKHAVNRGVEKIMKEKADLILFTGDLVNNTHAEMDAYLEIFNKVKAPMGVFSTLGNHDYGDYKHWDTPEEKIANFEGIKNLHGKLGWQLLMNEHVVLERGTDKIALIGVENWSTKANFPKYGHLEKAYTGTEPYPFRILMSHDPSHWKGQVIPSYPAIDLMLSGHTHGLQFGVELPGIKWSPVQYVYKEWAGLYEKGSQKLYVNRGYGFLGYPGRVGILPEITVLELV
jgi:predicted MPP superfamily phosphohydrolase